MTQHVSECPNCHTSFSISEEQLEVADGMVRCGSCLHIYNAREQIANASNEEQTPLPSSTDEDDWLIDDNFIYEKDENDTDESETDAPLFETNAPLFDESSWSSNTETNESGELEFSEDILNFDEQNFEDDALFKDFEELEKSQAKKSSEDWAEDLLKEEDENSPENAAFQDILAQLDTNYKNIPLEKAAITTNNTAPPPPESNFNLGAANPIGTQQNLQFKQENAWFQLFKKIGIVSLIALLIGQYIYYQFDELSLNPKTRPVIAVICNTGLCELKKQRDINKIKTTNLVVRNHPNINNSLKVDLILSNRAKFEQNFPKLTLQFRDLKGKVIAGRTFKPQSYLSGELKSQQLMPINQAIHLEFEIVDPGKDAINYEIIVSD